MIKYINRYLNLIKQGITNLDSDKLLRIEKIIFKKIRNNKKIFVCGNGGSASVANHFLCDFNKGIKLSSNNKLKPKIVSLSDNMETILAIGNDLSFDKIFTFQLDNYYTNGDIVILLSCSGSSSNIIDTLNYCKKKKIFTISITGFAKKVIQKKADINLDLGIKNYGVSEDFFQIIMHMLSQSIRLKFIKNTQKTIL
jgi:D-sedoheptulose 7-phosphate isomerase